MGLLFEGCSIGCGYRSQTPKHGEGVHYDVNQSLNVALGGSIDFPSPLNELFPRCSLSVEVDPGSNHSTFCRHPVQQLMTAVAAILYPTALLTPGQQRRLETGRSSTSGGRSSNRKISALAHGEGCRNSGAAGFLGMIESWSCRKTGSNCIHIPEQC